MWRTPAQITFPQAMALTLGGLFGGNIYYLASGGWALDMTLVSLQLLGAAVVGWGVGTGIRKALRLKVDDQPMRPVQVIGLVIILAVVYNAYMFYDSDWTLQLLIFTASVVGGSLAVWCGYFICQRMGFV